MSAKPAAGIFFSGARLFSVFSACTFFTTCRERMTSGLWKKAPASRSWRMTAAILTRYGGMEGNTVSVDELPPKVVKAFLAIEDRRFYDHFGIDPWGLVRAMGANVLAGRWVQGGSTITQQLAKNLFLTPDKTLRRKVQEALLALRIEYQYDKDDILVGLPQPRIFRRRRLRYRFRRTDLLSTNPPSS
jgi:membrane peptidoglycan carboxypeptidase